MSLNFKVNSLKSSSSLTRILEVPKSNMGSNRNITSLLNLARKKLLPVINKILNTASENTSRLPYQNVKSYHLTIEQYKDAIWATNVLKEVDEILKFSKVKCLNNSVKPQNFNFDTKNIKVNKSGKIYVDTPILVQLIDLYNMLGDIIDYIKDLPAEAQRPKKPQKSKVSSPYKSNTTSSASMDKKKKAEVEKMTKEILTTVTSPLNTNFLVMAANSVQKSYMPCLPEEKSTSEINLPPPTIVQVRHCKSTGSVMDTGQKSRVVDAMAARKIIIRCLADLDRVKQYLEQDSDDCKTPFATSFIDNGYESPENDEPCDCCECSSPTDDGEPLNFVWKDDGENGSKLIICIKGKSEDDGDIHVVIRQCPECLQTPNKKSTQRFGVSIENLDRSARSKSSCNRRLSSDRALSRARSKQSQNDAINVLFDPDEPSQSIVEGPQLKLYETINLNLQNNEGQDLVISLCVKPKSRPQKTNSGFNLEDIFSECLCKNKKSRIHVVERMMPLLSRTKICSSMDFDVDLVVSRLNITGVQHPNPEIFERLNDLGVYNILRGSRPVRCGRKAVLNEHQRKSLPYSASLRSLPLDDYDMAMINQSINMCLHKSKHSRIFPDSKNMDSKYRHKHFEKYVYFLQILQQPMKFFDDMEIRKTLINKKLSFYIYLSDDIRRYENSYEVRYFNVKNNRQIPVKIRTNPKISLTIGNKQLTTTSLYKNPDLLKQNSRSTRKCLMTRIPIYVKNYTSRLNTTQKGNTCCKNVDFDKKQINNDQILISADHSLNKISDIITRGNSNINKVFNEKNYDKEIHKQNRIYENGDIGKIRSFEEINNNTINIAVQEIIDNNKQINSNFKSNSRKGKMKDNKDIVGTSSNYMFNKNILVIYQDLDKKTNEIISECNILTRDESKINSGSMSSDSFQSITNFEENLCSCCTYKDIDQEKGSSCQEINKNNHRMNNDSEINYIREIKSTCNGISTKRNFTSCHRNCKITKNFRSDCNMNKTMCGEDRCSYQRKKIKHKINRKDISRYEQINSQRKANNNKVEIIVNTLLNNNGDNDKNERKIGKHSNIKQKRINKSKKLVNTVLKKVVEESFENENITNIKKEAIQECTKLMNIVVNKAMKEVELNRNFEKKKITDGENEEKRSFIILKEAQKNVGEQNSLASGESLKLFKTGFKNSEKQKESFILKPKKRRKKRELYLTRSHTQLLVGRVMERKITFIDFFNKKIQKRSSDDKRYLDDLSSTRFQKQIHSSDGKGYLDLNLSSTRFKRELNLGRTLSKMIINNFSKFLYEAILRELSIETRVEILSKIDEFLGKYCKLKSISAKSKGSKTTGRCRF